MSFAAWTDVSAVVSSNGEIFQITWLIEAAAFLIAAVTIPLRACVYTSVCLHAFTVAFCRIVHP